MIVVAVSWRMGASSGGWLRCASHDRVNRKVGSEGWENFRTMRNSGPPTDALTPQFAGFLDGDGQAEQRRLSAQLLDALLAGGQRRVHAFRLLDGGCEPILDDGVQSSVHLSTAFDERPHHSFARNLPTRSYRRFSTYQ